MRGGLGDGVDAGDVGRRWLQVPAATVAAGDGDRSLSTPLTRYYAEAGTPPGHWLGSGVTALGNGELTPGAQVSEAQLQLLVGMGRDPITGDPLGRAYPVYSSTADRAAQLDPSLGPGERGRMVAQIEAEEAARGRGVRWRGLISRSVCRSRRRCCGRLRTRGRRR
ncbi:MULTISPECIES: relaxase domain-containing protein [Corynebacterium]|uniref:relaxase domain-containing protein n=1 Tax=Corynebacterium TaxID=1716 RepID=UPI00339046F0